MATAEPADRYVTPAAVAGAPIEIATADTTAAAVAATAGSRQDAEQQFEVVHELGALHGCGC